MPKVSIVLPNYNYAQYLDERIQSLLNQTYRDFELIILDDASQDNSIEVIEKYRNDPRVKTKYFSENSGLPYQRWNDGADMAQGEYLLIAGADDSCHPTLVEKLVEKLDNYPQVGLAYSQSWEMNSQGKRWRSMKNWTDELDKERWAEDFVQPGINELKYLFFKTTIPNASAVLMRRNIFLEAGKFDTQMRLAADWILWVKILMISDIAFVAEPLNYFRTHASTVTSLATKSGILVEENYQVQKYMLTCLNFNFSAEDIDWVCDRRAKEWVHTIFTSPGKLNFPQQIKIYQVASSIDPKLIPRLTKKFSLRLFAAIKNRVLQHL